jgi:hypothetical protein
MRIVDMKNAFQIFGPFEVEGAKVAEKEYLETFWGERDEECPQLSEANGLYLFSLRNGSNYEPNYVGITKTRAFRNEVFNSANVVKILYNFVPERGTLCLHLIAKPKDTNVGFYRSHKKSLLWTEMFILLLCRRKNPEILNIVGRAFLENCGIEGITYPAKGQHKAIKTFRNALAIESFGMVAGNGRKKPADPTTIQPTADPTIEPTAHPSSPMHIAVQGQCELVHTGLEKPSAPPLASTNKSLV